MKYQRRNWKENRGFGHSASVSCSATDLAERLTEILWKLTYSYDQADRDTEMSILQMDEANGQLAGIKRDLDRLVVEAQKLFGAQGKKYINLADAAWQEQTKQSN